MYKKGREYIQLFNQLNLNKYDDLVGIEIIYTREGKKGKIVKCEGKYITLIIDGIERDFTKKVLDDIVILKLNDQLIESIKSANYDITCGKCYINKKMYDFWRMNNSHIYNILKNIDYNMISEWIEKDIFNEFKRFIDYYNNYENISVYNNRFIEYEKKKYDYLFNDLDGISLDENQIEVIIKDEVNHLILAGAGCGKTTLIYGKIRYLIEKYKLNPEDILVLSFSNRTVDDLKNKLNCNIKTQNIEVSTVHKLGKNIIKDVEKIDIGNVDDKEIKNIVKSIFEKLLDTDDKFQKDVIDFYTNYKLPMYDDNEVQLKFKEYMKNSRKIITIKGEVVRSYEELMIANFLYTHGISYKYESRYQYDSCYKPDFYLDEYGIYLEHYGIDENNNTSNKVKDSIKYNQDILMKREKHKLNNTILIETYSYMNKYNMFKYNLKNTLQRHGLKLKKIDNEVITNRIRETLKNDSFIDFISKALQITKSDINIREYVFNTKKYSSKFVSEPNYYITEREEIFIRILNKIYIKYEDLLKNQNLIDFSDMIVKAEKYIPNSNFAKRYKYVIVDEYQDISNSMDKLIKLICKSSNCKLLCVGDDWQSIYRFRGSNVGIIKNFMEDNIFSEVSYITNTYRFDRNLVNISNQFILKDNCNIPKYIISKVDKSYEQCLIVRNIVRAIERIDLQENGQPTNIFFIGRYNEDLDKLKENKEYKEAFIFDNDNNITYKNNINIKIKFLTVHASKGLEADYAIIINCNKGTIENELKGFPSEVENDPILDKLLDIGEGIDSNNINKYGKQEERRLFYVALTRAKKQVYLNLPKDEYASEYMYDIKDIKATI